MVMFGLTFTLILAAFSPKTTKFVAILIGYGQQGESIQTNLGVARETSSITRNTANRRFVPRGTSAYGSLPFKL